MKNICLSLLLSVGFLCGCPQEKNEPPIPVSLSRRELSIVKIAACTAIGDLSSLQEEFDTALNSGMSLNEIKEILIPASVDIVEKWAFQLCEELEKITVTGSKTNIVWPAVSGRRDKEPIIISAPVHSPAAEYCEEYGAQYHLSFQPLRYS